jgi:hypothetical protein
VTRILADLPQEDIAWLDARAALQGKSRAAVLRELVSACKAQAAERTDKGWIERYAGLWADRDDIPAAVEFQRAMRADRTIYADL